MTGSVGVAYVSTQSYFAVVEYVAAGRYREVPGTPLFDEALSEANVGALLSGIDPIAGQVELGGFLYNTLVHVSPRESGKAYVRIDRDGLPVALPEQDIELNTAETEAYIDRVADSVSFTDAITPDVATSVDSWFVKPAFEILQADSRRSSTANYLSWSTLKTHSRVVVLGPPGAGKTSCLRRLVVEARNEFSETGTPQTIPIYIQLRELSSQTFDFDILGRVLRSQNAPTVAAALKSERASTHILLIIDGLDEVHNSFMKSVLSGIHQICRLSRNVRVVVSCRESVYERELDDFTHVRIKPFDNSRIEEWSYQYLCRRKSSREFRRFVHSIEEQPDLQEVVRNPLLLSVAASLFARATILPRDRGALMRKFLITLIEDWDARRGIDRRESGDLSVRRLLDLLARLCFRLVQEGKSSFTEKDFKEVAHEIAIKDDALSEGLALLWKNGIVTQRSGEWLFENRLTQDYLAARYLVDLTASAEPFLVDYLRSSPRKRMWLLSCTLTSDAGNLLCLALQSDQVPRLERASLVADALSHDVMAERTVIRQCVDLIVGVLEDNLMPLQLRHHPSLVLPGASELGDRLPALSESKRVLWYLCAVYDKSTFDDSLSRGVRNLLRLVYSMREAVSRTMLEERLLTSTVAAVRTIAGLFNMEGEFCESAITVCGSNALLVEVTESSN